MRIDRMFNVGFMADLVGVLGRSGRAELLRVFLTLGRWQG